MGDQIVWLPLRPDDILDTMLLHHLSTILDTMLLHHLSVLWPADWLLGHLISRALVESQKPDLAQ
jgi:hypothetical protein